MEFDGIPDPLPCQGSWVAIGSMGCPGKAEWILAGYHGTSRGMSCGFTWAVPWNPVGSHGIPWGIPWGAMALAGGCHMRCHGTIREVPWDPTGSHGFSSDFVGFHKKLCNAWYIVGAQIDTDQVFRLL